MRSGTQAMSSTTSSALDGSPLHYCTGQGSASAMHAMLETSAKSIEESVTTLFSSVVRVTLGTLFAVASAWCFWGSGPGGTAEFVVHKELRQELKPRVKTLVQFKVRSVEVLEVASMRADTLAKQLIALHEWEIDSAVVTDTIMCCVVESIDISVGERLVASRLADSRANQWSQHDVRSGIVGWWGWLFHTPWPNKERLGRLPNKRV